MVDWIQPPDGRRSVLTVSCRHHPDRRVNSPSWDLQADAATSVCPKVQIKTRLHLKKGLKPIIRGDAARGQLDPPSPVCQSCRLGGLWSQQSLSGTAALLSRGSGGLEETASGRRDAEGSFYPGSWGSDLSEWFKHFSHLKAEDRAKPETIREKQQFYLHLHWFLKIFVGVFYCSLGFYLWVLVKYLKIKNSPSPGDSQMETPLLTEPLDIPVGCYHPAMQPRRESSALVNFI